MTRGRNGNGVGPASRPGRPVKASSRVYVMVGSPGAGKGTQAQLLSTALGLPHIASGDLFRAALASGSALGEEARSFMDGGSLVPDGLTVRMIAHRLDESDAAEGAILDGFPRTLPQARALDDLLAERGSSVRGALYIDVSQDELVRRLSGRWICQGAEQHVYHETLRPPAQPGICDVDGSQLHQRPDDRPDTIRTRLELQLPPMYEVVDHYADRGVLVAVPGEQPVEQVTSSLLHAIDRAAAAQATP